MKIRYPVEYGRNDSPGISSLFDPATLGGTAVSPPSTLLPIET